MTEDSDGRDRSSLDASAFRRQMIGVFGPFDRFHNCITSITTTSSGISNLHGVIAVPTTVAVVPRDDSRCASPNVSTAMMLQSMQNLVDRSPLHPPTFTSAKKDFHTEPSSSSKPQSIENDENRKATKRRQRPTEARNGEDKEKRKRTNRETDEETETSRDSVGVRLTRRDEEMNKKLFGNDPETGKKAPDKGTPDSGVLSAENGLDDSLPNTDTILSLLTSLSPMLTPPRFSRSADNHIERAGDTCISPIRTRPTDFYEKARERLEQDRKEAEKEKKEKEKVQKKRKDDEKERRKREREQEDVEKKRREERDKKLKEEQREKEEGEKKVQDEKEKREKEEKIRKEKDDRTKKEKEERERRQKEERERKEKEERDKREKEEREKKEKEEREKKEKEERKKKEKEEREKKEKEEREKKEKEEREKKGDQEAKLRKEKEIAAKEKEVESRKKKEEEKEKKRKIPEISAAGMKEEKREELNKRAGKLKKKREQYEMDCDPDNCCGKLDISLLGPKMIVRLRAMRTVEADHAKLEKELFGAVSNALKKNGQIENGVVNMDIDDSSDEMKLKKEREHEKEVRPKDQEKRRREKEKAAQKEKKKNVREDTGSPNLKVKNSMSSRDMTPSPILRIVKTAPQTDSESESQRKIPKLSKEIQKNTMEMVKRKESLTSNPPRPLSQASSPAPTSKKHPNGKRTESPLPSTSAGGFTCVWMECEPAKALRPQSPPAGTTAGEYFQTLAKETKHKADKESDKVPRLLLYLESAVYFIRSCSGTSQTSKLQSVLKETHILLKFVASSFLNSESLTSLHKHFRGRMKEVTHKALAILMYHTYNLRSDSATTIKNLRLIDTLEKTQIEKVTDGSTPSPCGSTQSGSGGSANKPTTNVGKVQMPAALAAMYAQQLKILSNLMWAHRYWEDASQDSGTLERKFIAKVENICGRIAVDSSLETLMSFIMTSAEWMRVEYDKEKNKPPPSFSTSATVPSSSSTPNTNKRAS